jgi:RHS repeat-associated protein
MRYSGSSGFMGARYRYTPYGQLDRTENVTATSDSELGYTGGLRLGYVAGAAQQGSLLLLGARVYHAELKRWLVPDTVDGRRYTYAGGDPVNFVDPSGRAPANATATEIALMWAAFRMSMGNSTATSTSNYFNWSYWTGRADVYLQYYADAYLDSRLEYGGGNDF